MIWLTNQAITVSIAERYASTSYAFTFENRNEECSNELRFEITIDPDAFISGFTANIDGELFYGETKEKKEAKQEYISAKQKNENAILISQPFPDIPNVFQIKTNIEAKSTILLTIHIEQYLKKKLHFNELTVEIIKHFRNYNIQQKCDEIQMNINIVDKRGIYDITLPSHITYTNTLHESNTLSVIHATIPAATHLNEFTLKYKVKGEQETSSISYDKKSKTFIHILNMSAWSASGYIPRRVVFVIDKSGSMSGGKWRKTIHATVTALKQLKTGYDRYGIMFFNSSIHQSRNEMILADTDNIGESIQYVNDESAGGATNINDALLKAIELIQRDDREQATDNNLYINQIIFMTDGEANAGETNTNHIISNVMNKNRLSANKISIFCFGVGSDRNDSSWVNDLNHSFLKLLSVNNDGMYKRIKESQCDTQLNDYFNMLSKPVAKNIKVSYDMDGITDIDLTQAKFHTLYDGNDLIICGAIKHHKTLNLNVNISAITGDKSDNAKPLEMNTKIRINLSTVESCSNIQRIWAYLKLKQFAERRLMNDDIIEFDDDDDEIPLSLAMRYKFVTPWTSMIVVKHKEKQMTIPEKAEENDAKANDDEKSLVDQARDMNIDTAKFAQESIKDNADMVAAMKCAATQLKQQFKAIDIDQVEDIQDEMMDLMDDTNEINDILGEAWGMDDFDEDDLMYELDGLDDELDDLDMNEDQVPSYMVSANSNKPSSMCDEDNAQISQITEEKEEKKGKTLKEMIFHRPGADKRDPNHTHKFWNTEPVPEMGDKFSDDVNEAIEMKTLDDVRKIPLLLPSQFEWVQLELNDDKEIDELYNLLAQHYVEDNDNRFRFNYSKEFLRWALMVPGYLKEWHLGVRVVKSGALCGCITAIPASVSIYNKSVSMVEINFLCVHKKLRSNRLAPVLIKEITRRVNCSNRWQAVYTAGVLIPKPIASNRYWHRSLNPEKLVDVGFSSMNKRMTKPRLRKLYKLPSETSTKGLRRMSENHCVSAHRLLSNYLQKFGLFVEFNLEEFKHCFLTRKGVVYSYVVVNEETQRVTDFISFYELPSSVMNHPKYKGMRAAYSYYNVVTTVEWSKIMRDALILANKHNFDVFNALDVMQNQTFLKELKFKIGDGHLQYYLYNWKCKELTPDQVALVLL